MAHSGGETAAVWLGGADASDLLSLFRYLGFDASGVDPAQLLAAADWAATARPHRLVRAVRKLLDGSPYPVRAGVAFDDAAFRDEPDIQLSLAGSSAGSRAGSEPELLGLGASAATLHQVDPAPRQTDGMSDVPTPARGGEEHSGLVCEYINFLCAMESR